MQPRHETHLVEFRSKASQWTRRNLFSTCDDLKIALNIFSKKKVFHSLIPEAGWATLTAPLFSWLMVGEWELCGVERFHHQKQRRKSSSGCMKRTKGAFKHATSVPAESGRVRMGCETRRDSGVTVRRHGDPLSPKGRTAGVAGCPVRGPVGLLRCHLHTMWQTPLVGSFFTLPHPLSSTFLDKWVKTPSPGATTGKDGDCVDSASPGFSPHHFTLASPACALLCPLPFSGFRPSLLTLWLQDFYQGLAQTYATCHPAVHGRTAWSQM